MKAEMKTAYTIIEENKIRTIILFFLYSLIFVFLAIILYYTTKVISVSLLTIAYGFFYGFYNFFRADKTLLWLTKAKKLDKESYKDICHPYEEIYRLVENLSIAAGLPKIPEIYVIDTRDMNAFAIGTKKENYKVVLTKGIIEKLDKNELEGVIAHEISHIKNNDTKLMTWAAILVSSIVVISEILVRAATEGNNRRGNVDMALVFILIVSALLAPFFAEIIQLAISRKREFIADSTAALLTRNPLALASALEKVSKSSQKYLQKFPQISALFVVNPFKEDGLLNKINNLFSSHPPIEKRIKILRGMVI